MDKIYDPKGLLKQTAPLDREIRNGAPSLLTYADHNPRTGKTKQTNISYVSVPLGNETASKTKSVKTSAKTFTFFFSKVESD